jgi:nucleoside-diphosphate-sugar epimerase
MLIFGLGYTGRAVAAAAAAAGLAVTVATRDTAARAPAGVRLVGFAEAAEAVGGATHLLATAPPGEDGDPVLRAHGDAIAAAPIQWIGYLSTTGVYGDRRGGWVDETTAPAPTAERSRRRLAAEAAWRAVARGRPLDLFRLAGIYGPGRSAFDELRAGTARRVLAPGHCFGRIHRDDIVAAVLAAARQPGEGVRVLNLADEEPAESAQVIEEAARLLGVAPPPAVTLAEAWEGMSPMARSFWSESRRVDSRRTRAALGIGWRYPSFREGLAAILAEERAQHGLEQGEVLRA